MLIRRQIDRVVDFEAGKFGPAVLSALYFFCLLFGCSMLRPLRDALGLERGVDSLQLLLLVTLSAMVVAIESGPQSKSSGLINAPVAAAAFSASTSWTLLT